MCVRVQGDSLVYQVQKQLKELGDKVPEDTKSKVEAKVTELEDALKGEDTDKIKVSPPSVPACCGRACVQVECMHVQPGKAMFPQDSANGSLLFVCFRLLLLHIARHVNRASSHGWSHRATACLRAPAADLSSSSARRPRRRCRQRPWRWARPCTASQARPAPRAPRELVLQAATPAPAQAAPTTWWMPSSQSLTTRSDGACEPVSAATGNGWLAG